MPLLKPHGPHFAEQAQASRRLKGLSEVTIFSRRFDLAKEASFGYYFRILDGGQNPR